MRKRQAWAFLALCLGFFMVILDVTIVNVTLPSIADYFSATLTDLQWVVDAYTLAFAGLLLLVGSLSDRFCAKRIFQIGLLAFALTSLACALAPSVNLLITFRLLQGAAAALLLPPSLALIKRIYQTDAQRARAIGTWAAVGGGACASGPFLGGVLTSLLSWRAVFAVNVMIAGLSFYLTWQCIQLEKQTVKRVKFDRLGQVMGTLTIAALAYALISVGSKGWHSPAVYLAFGSSILTGILFLITESRVASPMLPLALFNNKLTAMGLIVALVLNMTFYGILFTLPFYFENARHYTVLITGFALLPLPSLAVIGSYLSGKLIGRWGAVNIMGVGLLIAMVGFFGLLNIRETAPHYLWIMLPFLLIGFGVSFTTPAMTFAAINSAAKQHDGIAAAVLNMLSQAGSLLGVALFGSIIVMTKDLVAGLHVVFFMAGSLFLVMAVCSWLLNLLSPMKRRSD